jgi:proteasome lid subunit RPN8/RPN11
MQGVRARTGAWRYRLELWLAEGRRVHEVPLAPADFARAVEATFFAGLRRGAFRSYAPPAPEQARLAPLFGGSHTPALTRGFEVALPSLAGEEVRQAFDLRFFTNKVRHVGARLAVAGRLPGDAVLLYHLVAYAEGEGAAAPTPAFAVEAVGPDVPIRPGSRRALGPTEAWDAPGPDDFPVLVPRRVLEEAVEEARRAPEREVGGVLLGHLRRDEGAGELFLEVTCLVPAEETEATDLSVTFTHATWARAREVLEWRGEGEVFAGWAHSHPFRLCKECPAPVPAECVRKVLFYSSDDEFLMELSFARPFMVGLLAAVEPRLEAALGHLPVRLFGWRDGLVRPRGFEVFDG